MASTWSALKIELLETGANSGTWGTATNVNLGDALLGEAITGSATVNFATDADVTVTLTDSATSQSARNLRLNITESSTGIGSVRNLILGSGCQIEKFYLINNTGTGAKTVKNTTGTGISVPAGKSTLVFNDGTNVVDGASYFTSLTLGSALPVASGGTGLTAGTSGGVLAYTASGTLASSGALTASALVIGGGAGAAPSTTTTGTGVVAALGVNTGSAGAMVLFNGALGTPSSGTATNLTGTATTLNIGGNAAGLSATLVATSGGTGQSSYAVGDIVYASTTTALSKLADVATGNALISGGIGVAPSYGKIALTTHVSGTLPIANGGTNGTATPTANGVTYGTGTTIAYTAAGTTGQVLTATTSGAPSWASPATSGTVTSVAGTGTVNGISLSGTVTTSGSLTLGGALSGVSLTSQVTGTLPAANGGTGVANNAAMTVTGSGNFAYTRTLTAATNVTFPTTGTLATLAGSETFTNKTLTSPTLTTPALGTPSSGTLSSCTVDGTNSVGFLNIPQNSQSTAYTLVLADAGKHIFHPSTDANVRTFTIPANSSVAYPIGTAITFINMTSNVVTIAITTDTMYLSSAGTTGSRSLAQYGSATAIKMTSTTWLISGSGLT